MSNGRVRFAGRYITLPDMGVGAWGRNTVTQPFSNGSSKYQIAMIYFHRFFNDSRREATNVMTAADCGRTDGLTRPWLDEMAWRRVVPSPFPKRIFEVRPPHRPAEFHFSPLVILLLADDGWALSDRQCEDRCRRTCRNPTRQRNPKRTIHGRPSSASTCAARVTALAIAVRPLPDNVNRHLG